MSKVRLALPLLVFLAVAAFLAIGLTRNPRDLPSPLVGKPAPSFHTTILGQPGSHFTPSDLKGKVWLLNVWASWCASCRVEHPVLMRFAHRGLVPVIGLNYKDKADAALHWLQTHGNPYRLSVFDPDGRIGIDYGVYGVPETFLIDGNGHIRLRHAGPVTEELLEKRIVPLVNELNGT